MPRQEQSGNLQRISYEELRRDWDFVGLDRNGRIEVFRHKRTGQLRYVGRPFIPTRKWWQVWKRRAEPGVDAHTHDYVYKAACELIHPYVGQHLGNGVIDWSARRQLRRGCEMLSRVLQFNPDNWAALWFRGIAHRCLREPSFAYDDFRRAYNIERENPDVARELVLVCIDLGKGEEAASISSGLIDKHPTDVGLLSNHALALLAAGHIVEAKAAVERALQLAPNDHITQNCARHIARAARPKSQTPAHVSNSD